MNDCDKDNDLEKQVERNTQKLNTIIMTFWVVVRTLYIVVVGGTVVYTLLREFGVI